MKYSLLFVAIITAISAAVTVGDWTGTLEVDPMTDSQTIVLETYNSADLMGALFLGTDVPVFTVLFSEDSNVPVFAVQYTQYVGMSGRTSTCLVRVDDDPAVEYPVVIANDSETIGISIGSDEASKEFYASILRGSQVMFRFQPAGRSEITSTFSLSGITGVSTSMGIDVDQYLETSEQTDQASSQWE